MSLVRGRAAFLTAAVLVLVSLPACSLAGGITSDDRVAISTPGELNTVSLPFRLAWTTRDLPPTFSRYAVFVDRLPLAPGRSLRSMADPSCKRRPGCPDAAYLRTLNVYVTDRPALSIESVPILAGVGARASEPVHQATLVLLDRAGRRTTGVVDSVAFRVRE